MLHMFQATYDLDIFKSGHDGMDRLVECLQATATKTVNGHSSCFHG